jgi:membrane protein
MSPGWKERFAEVREHAFTFPGVRRVWRAMLLVAHGFRGEAITLRASALTYLTLLSLVPLLAVVYIVIDLFSGEAQIRDRVQSYVNSQLGIGAGAAVAGALTTFTSKATIQTLGAIGFAVLLLSVLSLLWNIESAFNHIYGVRKPRSPLQRLLKYWSFLTLGPIFLTGYIYVTWGISRLNEAHGKAGHSEVMHAFSVLSSMVITYVGLAFLYKVLPNARVRLVSALSAAFVAGTVWELAKFLFAWLSGRMVQVHKIYGSVAVLPILLTWLYISWFIALIGCRLCFALDASRKPEPHPAIQAAAAREAFTARLIVALVQLHREGHGPVKPRTLADLLEASLRMVREGLQALASEGLAIEARNGGWIPGRDPSRITLAQVRSAARLTLRYPSQEADPVSLAVTSAFARAEGAAEAALSETLDSFLARVETAKVQTQAVQQSTPEPLLGVGQGAHKPA